MNPGATTGTTSNGCAGSVTTSTLMQTNTGGGSSNNVSNGTVKIFSSGGEMLR